MTPKDIIDQAEKGLRAEFYKKLDEWQKEDDKHLTYNYPEIRLADWWLSKFDTYTKDLLQSVVDMAEGMKINKESFNGNPDTHIRIKRMAYNHALSDIIKEIK